MYRLPRPYPLTANGGVSVAVLDGYPPLVFRAGEGSGADVAFNVGAGHL